MLLYVLMSRCHSSAAVLPSGTRLLLPLPPLPATVVRNVLLPPTATGCWAAVQLALPCCCFAVTPPVTDIVLPILCCRHPSATAVTHLRLLLPTPTVLSPIPTAVLAAEYLAAPPLVYLLAPPMLPLLDVQMSSLC